MLVPEAFGPLQGVRDTISIISSARTTYGFGCLTRLLPPTVDEADLVEAGKKLTGDGVYGWGLSRAALENNGLHRSVAMQHRSSTLSLSGSFGAIGKCRVGLKLCGQPPRARETPMS